MNDSTIRLSADTSALMDSLSKIVEEMSHEDEGSVSFVELCTDICRRNGKRKLVWIADGIGHLRVWSRVTKCSLPSTGGLSENPIRETGY